MDEIMWARSRSPVVSLQVLRYYHLAFKVNIWCWVPSLVDPSMLSVNRIFLFPFGESHHTWHILMTDRGNGLYHFEGIRDISEHREFEMVTIRRINETIRRRKKRTLSESEVIIDVSNEFDE